MRSFPIAAALICSGFVSAVGGNQALAQLGERKRAVIVVATGCFWCTESDFDKVPGVVATTSGYIGGKTGNPTYKQVSAGGTGHIEAVQVVYDPSRVSFAKLVRHALRTSDPTDDGGQFCDRGDQYRPAIFVGSQAERRLASAATEEAARSLGRPVATDILPRTRFYPAEDYHQNYYVKNPIRYRFYRRSCGRDARIKEVWGGVSK